MNKKKTIIISAIFALLILLSFYFDKEIVKLLSNIRSTTLNNIFLNIDLIGSGIILIALVTILFLFQKDKRKWILPSWFAIICSVALSFLLKIAIQRPRPFTTGIVSTLPVLQKAAYLSWDFSFPSTHTIVVFCALLFLIKAVPKLKYLWVLLALAIGFERVYFGLHYLSDVLIAGILGYLIAKTIIKTEKDNHFWEKLYNKIERKILRL